MKLAEAIERNGQKEWREAQVRLNPSNKSQWFIMLVSDDCKLFMLVDESESPIVSENINDLALLIRLIGLQEFTVYL